MYELQLACRKSELKYDRLHGLGRSPVAAKKRQIIELLKQCVKSPYDQFLAEDYKKACQELKAVEYEYETLRFQRSELNKEEKLLTRIMGKVEQTLIKHNLAEANLPSDVLSLDELMEWEKGDKASQRLKEIKGKVTEFTNQFTQASTLAESKKQEIDDLLKESLSNPKDPSLQVAYEKSCKEGRKLNDLVEASRLKIAELIKESELLIPTIKAADSVGINREVFDQLLKEYDDVQQGEDAYKRVQDIKKERVGIDIQIKKYEKEQADYESAREALAYFEHIEKQRK